MSAAPGAPTPRQWRKKPVVIEAVQWTGENYVELAEWLSDRGTMMFEGAMGSLTVPTLEGDHTANPHDWIIRGVAGEFYPCRPDIFAATYEPVAAVADPHGDHASPGPPAPRLAPCPFCGNQRPDVVRWTEGAEPRWRVVCLNCLHSNVFSEPEAIAAWNRAGRSGAPTPAMMDDLQHLEILLSQAGVDDGSSQFDHVITARYIKRASEMVAALRAALPAPEPT